MSTVQPFTTTVRPAPCDDAMGTSAVNSESPAALNCKYMVESHCQNRYATMFYFALNTYCVCVKVYSV